MLSAKPGAVNGADEGYDSDVTRDVAPRKVAVAATPAVATALPATRRSARTQKADAQDIVEKLSCLQTAEPSVGGNKKKRGAAPESQYESQGALCRLLSLLACRHLTFALPVASQPSGRARCRRPRSPSGSARRLRLICSPLAEHAATCAHVASA